MANEIKNRAKFNVLGFDLDVSEEDQKMLDLLNKEKDSYKDYLSNDLIIETYSEEKQIKVFNLKRRTGQVITFKNNANWTCVVDYCYSSMNRPVIAWHFTEKSQETHKVSVERFIEIYKKHEFHNVTPKGFYEAYLITVEQRVKDIDMEIKAITDKYDALYKEKAKSVENDYYNELNKYNKIEKEAPAKPKYLTAEEALEKAKDSKGVERTKTYWNTILTAEEKSKLMGWVSSNIYSIRIYALLGGQSGNALSAEYGNIDGIKLREPKYNENDEQTSEDNIGGYVYFKTIENAPTEIFEKIASNGRRFTLGGGTVPKRFADMNFALFLVSEYSKYGFVPGKRNLYRDIKGEELRKLFNEDSFNDGYFPF